MLSAGARLGPYEILSPLGAGGMGEVYRARDARLERDVAIKILPPSFAADPDRLARFEQEARAASALNHPNILIVFDIGSADGTPYVVTELLEGETLTGLVNGAALPPRKAIDYASQIARGLAAAHGRGIVHRDLKPDNVFVTADGRLKILDFGLAKLAQSPGEAGQAGATALPTAALPNTMPGVVLGTVGYMSPEQVRGRSTDHRADIFAFGAILYEMLSGRRAFTGESAIETMSAILKEEPRELSSVGRALPPALERIVHHCLEKSPDQRFQSASDIAFALEALSGSSDAGASPSVIASDESLRAGARGRAIVWKATAAAAALVGLVAVPFAVIHWREKPAAPRLVRFAIDLPEGSTFPPGGVAAIAVSPNGRYAVFQAISQNGSRLWLRPLDELSARPLPGTEGLAVNTTVFWSPDSQSIGFVSGTKLRRIDVAGGPPQTVADLAPVGATTYGATWSRSGVILIGSNNGIYSVGAAGGSLSQVTTPAEDLHAYPVALHDGRRFIFSRVVGAPDVAGLHLGSLDSRETKRLSADRGQIQLANGSLLVVRERSLLAIPFDEERGALGEGTSVIAEEVQNNPAIGRSAFAVSDTGVLVVYSGREPASQLTWFDRSGRALDVLGTPGSHATMAISPDQRRVVYGTREGGGFSQNLWVTDFTRNVTTKLTLGSNRDSDGTWSPDGSRIAFASVRDGVKSLYEIPAVGGAERVLLKSDGPGLSIDAWSPDGRFVVYHLDSTREMRALQLDGDRRNFVISNPPSGRADEASFSPDGKWLAYDSDESGRYEVYVVPFPPTGAKWQVSSNGGGQPRWRGDGRELFYLAPDGTMMAVDIKAGTSIESGTPHALFKTGVPPSFTTDQYAVAADGQRFLIMNPVGEARPVPMTVVLDWPALIKSK